MSDRHPKLEKIDLDHSFILDELLNDQIKVCTTRGHKIHIKVGRGFVERKEACIDWYNP